MQHAVIQALLKAVDTKYFTVSSISYFQEFVIPDLPGKLALFHFCSSNNNSLKPWWNSNYNLDDYLEDYN